MYYNIYLNKEITEEDNQKYFSFFYPGEAVIGMTTYYKYILKDKEIKSLMQKKLHSALNFLYVIRPKTHARQYMSLPSDAWLMMAVNEIWDIPEMRDNLYKKKVFKDADQMIDHMYTPDNALYPDYIGAYYYNYGNFPYADGARHEGLLGAYELAIKTKDTARIKKYENAIKLAIRSNLHLINTPESSYSVPKPEMTIGGVRFKHTRQWIKIDTIQHIIGFYIKFLKYLE